MEVIDEFIRLMFLATFWQKQCSCAGMFLASREHIARINPSLQSIERGAVSLRTVSSFTMVVGDLCPLLVSSLPCFLGGADRDEPKALYTEVNTSA